MDNIKAIEKWQQVLGEKNIKTDSSTLKQYTNNVSELTRTIQAVLYPSTTSEVQNIVAIANECLCHLYPISSGKNFGLGSKMPVQDGATIVDLRRMNKIHEVNVQHGYAVIESGVTQKQLYQYLLQHDLPYLIDVTGSGENSTFVGNALDRGIAYYSLREEDITNLEVVLGNGTLLNTGFGHYPNAKAVHLYRYGVGPSLDGLFFQSNFGIITRVGIRLIPKPEYFAALSGVLTDSKDLPRFIDILAQLKMKNILPTSLHIANRARSEISTCPLLYNYLKKSGVEDKNLRHKVEEIVQREINSPWFLGFSGLRGSKKQVHESYKKAKKALRSVAKIDLVTIDKIAWYKKMLGMLSFIPNLRQKRDLICALEPFYDHCIGIPNDKALESIYWPIADTSFKEVAEPDQSHSGKLYALPIIPMDGKSVQEVVELTETTFDKYGFIPYMTFNTVGHGAFETVINLAFDRSKPETVKKAHECINEINQIFMERGYNLYRVGIQSMGDIISEQDNFWQIVADLKKVFDPNHIIAPKRYNLV